MEKEKLPEGNAFQAILILLFTRLFATRNAFLTCVYFKFLPNRDCSCAVSSTGVQCGSVGKPGNGSVHEGGVTFEAVLTFWCNPGFQLRGSARRRCQEDGQWSGTAAICSSKHY